MSKREQIGGLPVGGKEPLIATAVRWGDLLFCSGRVAINPETLECTTDDLEEQVRISMDQIVDVLKQAGTGPENVLRVNCFLTHPGDHKVWDRIFAEYFPEPRPARTTVVSDLVVPGLKIEIEVTAGIPGD
jgi:2-iminobutanoate/2-iminopropanoate deaminase